VLRFARALAESMMLVNDDPAEDIEAYARLRARLAAVGVDRAALLAERGLDEETWEPIDERWQERLSEALEVEGDDLPELVLRYAAAFAEGQRTTGVLPSLERFAQCTRALQGARDPRHALERLGVTLTDYLRANQHWAPLLARDGALQARFRAAMRGPLQPDATREPSAPDESEG
jgi:hypothetical protein